MPKKIRVTRKKVFIAALVAIVLAGVAYFIFRPGKTVTTIPVIQTQSQVGAPVTSTGDKSNTSSQSTSDSSAFSPPTSSVASTPPANPSGQFVNFHSASWTDNTLEESTCVTSPGASCYIEFTSGDIINKLPAKITDSSGTAVWDWRIQDAKLTTGTWQVMAVAELNNQTRSTSGAPLEVTQ